MTGFRGFDAFPTSPLLRVTAAVVSVADIIAAPGAGKRIVVMGWSFHSGAGTVAIGGAGAASPLGPAAFANVAGSVGAYNPNGWFILNDNQALVAASGSFIGTILYKVIDA